MKNFLDDEVFNFFSASYLISFVKDEVSDTDVYFMRVETRKASEISLYLKFKDVEGRAGKSIIFFLSTRGSIVFHISWAGYLKTLAFLFDDPNSGGLEGLPNIIHIIRDLENLGVSAEKIWEDIYRFSSAHDIASALSS